MTEFREKVYPVRKTKKSFVGENKSEFSNGVYAVVKKIPKGKVMTYKEVAIAIGRPVAYRAVGNALNKSASWRTKIPCHRVICSNKKVGGYRLGTANKIKILEKERVKIKNEKVF